MKLYTSINSKITNAMTVVHACVNAITLDGETTRTWTRLGKWGEYPGHINHPGGGVRKGLQVLDKAGAEQMKKSFASAINQIAHLGKGLPIYEGHPDDPAWRKANPDVRKVAVGRIKEMEIREDGPYVLCVFNDRGVRLIGGDAPEISAHSPHFGLRAMQGNKLQIVELRSIGLTNDPNMPDTAISLNESTEPETGADNQNKTMKLNTDIMKRLGLNPEASEDATASAVNSVLDQSITTATDLEVKDKEITAANERIATLQANADKFRDRCIEQELSSAINEGKITEADKPKWDAALKTDFDGESAKLGNLMGTSINTKDRVGDLGKRKDEGAPSAVNEAITSYAKQHGLDLKDTEDYRKAFAGAQSQNPEVFAK